MKNILVLKDLHLKHKVTWTSFWTIAHHSPKASVCPSASSFVLRKGYMHVCLGTSDFLSTPLTKLARLYPPHLCAVLGGVEGQWEPLVPPLAAHSGGFMRCFDISFLPFSFVFFSFLLSLFPLPSLLSGCSQTQSMET